MIQLLAAATFLRIRVDRRRIIVIEASHTHATVEFAVVAADRLDKAFVAQEVERIRVDRLTDFLHALLRRDQLLAVWRVDAIVAGVLERRRRDVYMHFRRACFAKQIDNAQGRRAADDGIVDHHDALAFHHFADCGQLHLHALLAQLLRRLDERPARVFVLNQAKLIWNPRLLSVPDRRGNTRIRHACHDVRVDERFKRQLPPHPFARRMKIDAIDVAVGTGKINVLHCTGRMALQPFETVDAQAVLVENEQLARLDVSLIDGTDGIQRAGLRRKHITVAHAAHNERTQAMRIGSDQQLVVRHDKERESADNALQRVFRRADEILVRTGDQMRDDFRVARRLEDRALALQFLADGRRVHDVAVRRYAEVAVAVFEEEWLRVREPALACGRIPNMPDDAVAWQAFKRSLVKYFFDQAHVAVVGKLAGRGLHSCHPSALFAPVLQRVKAVVAERASIRHIKRAEHPALLT